MAGAPPASGRARAPGSGGPGAGASGAAGSGAPAISLAGAAGGEPPDARSDALWAEHLQNDRARWDLALDRVRAAGDPLEAGHPARLVRESLARARPEDSLRERRVLVAEERQLAGWLQSRFPDDPALQAALRPVVDQLDQLDEALDEVELRPADWDRGAPPK